MVAPLPTEPDDPPPLGVLTLMGALQSEPDVLDWAASVEEIVAARHELNDREPPAID